MKREAHPPLALISTTSRRVAKCALALAIALLSTFLVSQSVEAQVYSIVYSFTGVNGIGPGSSLAQDTAGNLYGVSPYGDGQGCYSGCGAVYKLDPTGRFTVLYTFQGKPDVANPEGVILDAKGNLYGTTQGGGSSNSQACGSGCGAVFKLATTGEETILHSFAGPPGDGMFPYAGAIRDARGNLYGTTLYGGAYSAFGNPGEGTIFKVTAAGKETVLYDFTGQADGGMPWASLLLRNGVLYGTTSRGGTGPCGDIFGNGCGTVFRLEGKKETVLYSFNNKSDGGYPLASLISDKAGNLYGTTAYGGDLKCVQPPVKLIPSSKPPIEQPPSGCGTVFKISPTGKETVLYTFTGTTDGSEPGTALTMDSAGNLYGSTSFGGDPTCGYTGNGYSGCGTIFKIDTAGTFSVLHAFSGPDGAYPGDLIQDHEGNLYAPAFGGPANAGIIFKLTP
jgi:uncharacterized repeat protein (TIGR03803 family)